MQKRLYRKESLLIENVHFHWKWDWIHWFYFSLHHFTFFCRFERVISSAIKISDSLFIIQESEMIISRDRLSKTKNRRRAIENVKMNHHIDTKMKKIICERTNVQKLNIASIFAIRTRSNWNDFYTWWNDWFDNKVYCSSNWFSLEQKTKTRQKTRTITRTKTKTKTRTTRSRTSNIEINWM